MSNYITHKNDILNTTPSTNIYNTTPKSKITMNTSRNSSRESSPGRRSSKFSALKFFLTNFEKKKKKKKKIFFW
jgi:hypothetical protein